ncbi:MAG: ATP-binding protein [Isosphaeraceae bacterium]
MSETEGNADSLVEYRLSNEELRQWNAQLRDESARLREQTSDLMQQLAEARMGSRVDREARRAALNLMEDAVAARHAEQRENQERRRAEEELRASEEKYRSLFESIDEGFFIIEKVEPDGEELLDFFFVEANPAVAAQSGVSCVVGKTMRQAFPGEAEEWYLTFDDILKTGESTRFERELLTQARTLELYAFPLGDAAHGRIAVIFKDVTQRKAVEAALREADRRKDEFLATLAHELRNPLAPISNCLQIFRLTADKDSMTEELCEMMERQVNHMVRLVDDLLELSRITRGSIELRKEATDLTTIIRSAVEISRPLIESFEHKLTISLPTTPVPLYGDVVRLGQVFANLLNNAVKYTDRGGQIWLGARQEDEEVVVSVRDSGIGISASMLHTIFDMFTQADPSSKRAHGGLGIGLTLAKRLVEMHGGTITAFSEGPGQGSEFAVRLQIASASEAALHESSWNQPGARISECRVLVVDDNEDSATSLGMLLKSLGTDVQTVHDGATALETIRSYRPDMVFLDLGMPGMDGVEVARQIRGQPDFEKVMLIALTGWGQEGDRNRTHEAGFDHHLVKPAPLSALQSLLSIDGMIHATKEEN